ncbi:MAG: DGQHR domain-containing protein [Candidatus Pacebacteria bacterium]|nr:DGQHR domain-containing protein [Candidatus Paceibacterota bacterium]
MKLQLLQLNKDFIKSTYVGKISFSSLKKIATITRREIADSGENNNLFQRPSDDEKVKKLSKFLKNKLLDENGDVRRKEKSIVVFPTALIIAINQKDLDKELDDEFQVSWEDGCLEFSEILYNAFIVDGQHRYLGILQFYEDTGLSLDDIDIELPVTVLVGYDLWEQAIIFADVNFNQKPVNRSLYYDIFGSMPGEPSKDKLAHSLVKYLNYNEESPFFGMIRMLGVGQGIISQAFLVEKIAKLFAPNKAFSIFYDDYRNGKTDQRQLANVFSIYFGVVRDQFREYYPERNEEGKYSSFDQHVLFKTTGIGAFCRLLNDFEKEIKLRSTDTEYLKEYFTKIFSLISHEEARKLFSKDGIFGGGSSEGTQVKLYKNLLEIIEYKKDALGKMHHNAKIVEMTKTEDLHGRNLHNLTLDNGTTSIISDEELLIIRGSD